MKWEFHYHWNIENRFCFEDRWPREEIHLIVAQYETKYHRGRDVNDYDASSELIYKIQDNILYLLKWMENKNNLNLSID